MTSDQILPNAASSSGFWETDRSLAPELVAGAVVEAGAAASPRAALPPRFQQTLRRLGPLSVSSEAVFRLLQCAGDDAMPVIAAIELCPTLTARLVSVINSAAFGVSWRIASVSCAVQVLGVKRARSIALAYALRNSARPPALTAECAQFLWAASVRKACAAKLFCEAVDPDHADAAYTLGLIQDIGLPMLMAANGAIYRNPPALAGGDGGAEFERDQLGLTHGTVGQELLLSWHASEKLQQIVLAHHRPPAEDEPLLHACYIAGLLPHLDEPMDPRSLELVEEWHDRHLRDHYETADAFLMAVADESRRLTESRAGAAPMDRAALTARLISAVTSESISAQTRLCKVEQAYRGQRESFASLREQAFTDALTRLLNRRGFMELADRRMHSEQQSGRGLCCMVFDLDGLKKLNDTYGHDIGDVLLRGFAKLLRRYFDEDDLIARFGGDEYAALIAGVDEATARKAAERIVDQIHRSRLKLRPDLEVQISCSAGAIFYDRTAGPTDIENVLSQADHVMYQRKHAGKAGLVFKAYTADPAMEAGGETRVGETLAAEFPEQEPQ